MDAAAYWAHNGIMENHGQNCCAGSRTFVQDTIYDEFVQKCVMFAENRCVGDPFDAMTQQGPQVNYFSILRLFNAMTQQEPQVNYFDILRLFDAMTQQGPQVN